MKVFITIFLIVAVISTVGPGFFMMDAGGVDHGRCLAALAMGVDCSNILNPIGLAGMHASFLAQFTNAIFAKIMLLVLLFVGLAYVLRFKQKDLENKLDFYQRFIQKPVRYFRSQFEHWFALHENSPSFGLGRR